MTERFTTAYAYDENNMYSGETIAQKDKAGKVLIPSYATLKSPTLKKGYNTVFKTNKWVLEKIIIEPVVVEEPIVLTIEQEAQLEVTKLENMITKRAVRESKRRGDSKIIGYENGKIYHLDVEAEIERLETEVLGR